MRATAAADILEGMNACTSAVDWLRTQRTWREAWKRCPRGDWLLWLLGRVHKQGSAGHRSIVLAACECARLALRYVPDGEDRPRVAIETAERWARRERGVSLGDVKRAAHAAANAAYYDAATAIAYAAANAAYYAANVAAAAYAAAAAAENAADAVLAFGVERAATLKRCATIVRRYFPEAPELRA